MEETVVALCCIGHIFVVVSSCVENLPSPCMKTLEREGVKVDFAAVVRAAAWNVNVNVSRRHSAANTVRVCYYYYLSSRS